MSPIHRSPSVLVLLAAVVCLSLLALRPGASASATPPQAEAATASLPAADIIAPEELARLLKSHDAAKPLVLQVGFRFLYHEAHIPGAEYAGPGSKDEGIKLLRQRVTSLPHDKFIVLYCGCCPWSKCPNVKPAYDALRRLGFAHVRVLRIEQNFGADWVSKGYPTAKGD